MSRGDKVALAVILAVVVLAVVDLDLAFLVAGVFFAILLVLYAWTYGERRRRRRE